MVTDATIGSLLDFVNYNLNKEEARQLLANNSNDLELAVQKFYETDLSTLKSLLHDSKPTWDDTAFGAGRYGNEGTSGTVPTFNIDYAPGFENYPHSAGQSRAPTRPPSRASQRSGMSTHTGDAPIQSIESAQESGYVIDSKPVFGPATKENYDTSAWALVPTTTEVISDPIPSHRQRDEGQPAILKTSPNFNYLPALIPILHSIPLFRNALLSAGVTQKNYWMGDDWWKGSASPPARIIDTTMGISRLHGRDILYEAQRLMAFLDNTDRIYGSVGALLDLDAWKEIKTQGLEDPDDDLLRFLLDWSFAFQSEVPDVELDGALRSIVNIAGTRVENFVLDAPVTRGGSKADISIYDVLDDALFRTAQGSAHIARISNVLILRLTSSNTSTNDLGCRVPATLYADRYLDKNRHVIDSMYKDINQYEAQLTDLEAQKQKIKYHMPQKEGAKKLESLKLLKSSMKAFESESADLEQDPKDAAVLSQLQNLFQSIESKLDSLEAETQQVQNMINGISGRFMPLVDDGIDTAMENADTDYPVGQSPQDAMKYPYQLYGVATRRDVVYLLHPDIRSDIPGAMQWWRMQYDNEAASPVIIRDRLTLQDVIERATSESASALLIYANEAATSSEPRPLDKPLLDFVKKDKLNFLEELQKNSTGWDDYNDYGNTAQGEWDPNNADWGKVPVEWNTNTAGYDEGWGHVNTGELQNREHNDSNMSSATLTPDTEVGDDGPAMQEMMEVNGGMDAFAGLSSASSETIGEEPAHADRSRPQGEVKLIDIDMDEPVDEPRTQHIEVAEKKGG